MEPKPQNELKPRGNCIAILYQEDLSGCQPLSVDDFEVAWKILKQIQFPLNLNLSNQENFKNLQTTYEHENGPISSQEKLLQYLLSKELPECRIIQLPQTLYELLFLREYLFSRPFSSFENIGTTSTMNWFEQGFDFGGIGFFLYDYKIAPDVSKKVFDEQCQLFIDRDMFGYLVFQLNTVIVDWLRNSPDYCQASLHGEFTPSVLNSMCHELIQDLSKISVGSDSEICRAFDKWPLQHPKIWNLSFSTDEIEKVYTELCFQIAQFRSLVKKTLRSLSEQDLEQVNQCSFDFWQLSREEDTLKSLLLNELWPKFHTLTSFSNFSAITINWLRTVYREMDPAFLVDVCVYYFRKPNYLDSQVIHRAVALEYAAKSEPTFFYYRSTAQPERDSTIVTIKPPKSAEGGLLTTSTGQVPTEKTFRTQVFSEFNPAKTHSLSFGLSLFSGVLFDRTACTYNYLRKKNMQGYIIQMSLYNPSEIAQQVFYTPPLHPLASLAGIGELFHPRTKLAIPQEMRHNKFYSASGLFFCNYNVVPSFLLSEMESFKVEKEWKRCLSAAQWLKTSERSKEILLLLLCVRQFVLSSPWHKDCLPTDVFMLILQLSLLGPFLPKRCTSSLNSIAQKEAPIN